MWSVAGQFREPLINAFFLVVINGFIALIAIENK